MIGVDFGEKTRSREGRTAVRGTTEPDPKLILWWLNLKLGDDLRGRGHRAQVEPRDRQGDRPARAEDRHPGGVRGGGRAAGQLVPAAPGQPGPTPPGARAAPGPGAAPRPGRRRAAAPSSRRCTRNGSLTPPRPKHGRSLLDEGTYLGSVSTYYRVLREAGESRERRAQAAHPATVKPELAATGPNQVYSWDITKLHGPAKWTYYHLYVILDILQPLRRRMDGRHPRIRRPGGEADRRDLQRSRASPAGSSPSTPTAAPR